MNCRPTTPGSGRWTCETCGADLGTRECKLAPDCEQCPHGRDMAFRTGPYLYQHCNPPTARDDEQAAERAAAPDLARCPERGDTQRLERPKPDYSWLDEPKAHEPIAEAFVTLLHAAAWQRSGFLGVTFRDPEDGGEVFHLLATADPHAFPLMRAMLRTHSEQWNEPIIGDVPQQLRDAVALAMAREFGPASVPPDEPAPSDYDRGIADAVAVIDSRIAASERRPGSDSNLQLRAEIYGAQWIRDAVAALKRGSE